MKKSTLNLDYRLRINKQTKLLLPAILVTLILGDLFQMNAQGINRSNGFGVRGTVWKHSSITERTSFGEVSVEGSGELYFFHRLKNQWFLETSIGGVDRTKISGSTVDTRSIVPFLFGARYDLLSPAQNSPYQPYVSFGAGTYWISRAVVSGSVIAENDAKLGLHVGSGLNIILKSWFALNTDIKYHFVNFGSDLDDLSGFELGFGFSFMWGKKREIFRIRETKLIIQDIYPAYYQFYNTYPLALVTVENTAGYPIEVNLRCKVTPFSSRIKESGFIKIEKGESKDLPATAIFGPEITEIAVREPAVLDIEVEGRAGTTLIQEISSQVTIHTRNSWDGEMDKLRFFVTPDNPKILLYTRRLIEGVSDSLNLAGKNFLAAKTIFNDLRKRGIRYQSDPNIPFYQDDRVQFANETLDIGSGDCDDLVVLYGSLLESLGINTAFIQVKDPEKSLAHLFLIFDTGIPAENSSLISSNEKRYILRDEESGQKNVWLPVETTLIASGFDKAWDTGALNYLQEAKIRNGISEGWVQIFDIR